MSIIWWIHTIRKDFGPLWAKVILRFAASSEFLRSETLETQSVIGLKINL